MDVTLLLAALTNAKAVCLQTLAVNPSGHPDAKAYLIAISDMLDRCMLDANYASMISSSGTFIPPPPGGPFSN